jgi:recombinational DNA repair protein RecT
MKMARQPPNAAANGRSGAIAAASPTPGPPVQAAWKQSMSQEKVGVNLINEMLVKHEPLIAGLIPVGTKLTSSRIITSVRMAISDNYKLKLAKPSSVLTATLTAARLGVCFIADQAILTANEARSKDRDGNWNHDFYYAGFMLGYQGSITILARNGVDVTTQAVFTNDTLTPNLTHFEQFQHIAVRGNRGEIEGAYAIFRSVKSGRIIHIEYCDSQMLDRAKAYSQSSAWSEWPEEMVRNVPIRRGFKRLGKHNDELILAASVVQSEYDETYSPQTVREQVLADSGLGTIDFEGIDQEFSCQATPSQA